MKEVSRIAAQGDVLFRRVESVPVTHSADKSDGRIIVTHSETGHHHAIDDVGVVMFSSPTDPFVCYLQIAGEHADVVHHRSFDTHETLRLLKGNWEVRRQREHTPEGFRRVED